MKVGSNSMVVVSSLVVMSQTSSFLPSVEIAHRYGLKRMVCPIWVCASGCESADERVATSLPRT